MNDYIIIKIYTKSPNYIIKTLLKQKINVYNINIQKKYLILKINTKDQNKLHKKVNYQVIGYNGLKKHINTLINNKILLLNIIIFLSTLTILNNLIFKVNVIHEKEEIRNIITEELSNLGINSLNIKKDYKELTEAKEIILTKYQDKIEWLEIIEEGINYNVKVQERIINIPTTSHEYCDIVASKEGMISNITSSSGEIIKESQEIAKEGDILISGIITLAEEEKAKVCATGTVYAHTWYKINIIIPKTATIKEYTGKERYNIIFENEEKSYNIFKSRLKDYTIDRKEIININNNSLILSIEKEYIKEEVNYTEEEINNLIDEEINNKTKTMLKEDYEILEKKVLKKTEKDSTIEIEVFLIIKEQIGVQVIKE